MKKKTLLRFSLVCFVLALATTIYEIVTYPVTAPWEIIPTPHNPFLYAIVVLISTIGMGFAAVALITLQPVYRTRFVVRYHSIYEHGYFIHRLFHFSPTIKVVKYESDKQAAEKATKFRYEWVARLWCKALNKHSLDNLDLRTWYVTTVISPRRKRRGFLFI